MSVGRAKSLENWGRGLDKQECRTLLYNYLPTRQPGFTTHGIPFVFLYTSFWLGDIVGDLGWGPRTRHLVYPVVPLGWKVRSYRNGSCCKQGDYRRQVYTYTGQEGRAHNIHGNLTAIYKSAETWYERQTGQDKHSRTESQSSSLRVFFLPLM